MRLLLLPVLLSSAQLATVNGASSWIFPGIDNGLKEKNKVEEATLWVNEVLGKSDNNLTNRFERNTTTPVAGAQGTSSWIFPGLDNGNMKKNTSKEAMFLANGTKKKDMIEEATLWVNEVLGKTDNNLNNRFKMNATTQLADVEGASAWVFPGLDNGSKKKNISKEATFLANDTKKKDTIEEATLWVNEVLGKTDNNLNNRFEINATSTIVFSCTTTDGKVGKCVKPQYCIKELPEKDPSTLFRYRESACSYLLQCCASDEIKQVPKKTKTLPGGCGWTNPGGYSFRTTDSDTTGFSDFADFPWMVALLKKSHSQAWSEKDYIGGGTLIHPSVVLTAAHKVDSEDPAELKCRAGEWDTKAEDEIYLHQDRNIRQIAIHDQFLRLRAYYDAALLFLESPFKLKDVYHIGVACLARDMPAPGTLCYSMGWGNSFNDTNYATLLKKIQLPLVNPETCQRQLRNTRLGSGYLLHHTLFCAGGEAGRDTCIGDGGSSLVCPIKSNNSLKRYAVYGMVAYGIGCGLKDIPGVYAKVPTMVDWINQEMKRENLGTTSYFTSV